ncbi:MAG: acyl-CoA dehydrogenase family protein [Opitutaceae bacterium]
MDFSLSPEQARIQKETVEFAQAHFSDSLVENDHSSQFNHEGWKAIADFGLLKGFAPKEYGGEGWDTLTKVIALEAFGYGCKDNGMCLAVGIVAWPALTPIVEMGSEAQKHAYIPKMISGECMPTNGITEPESGSDALSMKTTAKLTEEGYIINGHKCYIGFGPIADMVILFAKTDENAGSWGISAFLVDTDTPGIQKSLNREKMGLRTLPFGDLVFEDCCVPKSALLGSEGAGLSLFRESMEWERCFILATQVGAMKRQLEECIAFAKNRKQFGQSIGDFQSVSNRIADMRSRFEVCQMLLYKTAWMKNEGKSAALESSIAKLNISESFLASSLDAIRIHGAKGYLAEFEVERNLRDAIAPVIYAGTSDIQRNVIASLCGL